MPIVPDQVKVSDALAPKNSAHTTMIRAAAAVDGRGRHHRRAGEDDRPTPRSPTASRPRAKSSREPPTMQARQQPNALIAAPT